MSAELNVIDLILIDHKILKNCISVLINEEAEKGEQIRAAKTFLEVLGMHAQAEEASIYDRFENRSEFHFMILEGKEEHRIAKEKQTELLLYVNSSVMLSEELAAKMKVLAELVEHHLAEEEDQLLPELKRKLEKENLLECATIYLEKRGASVEQMKQHPMYEGNLTWWGGALSDLSQKVKEGTDRFMSTFKH